MVYLTKILYDIENLKFKMQSNITRCAACKYMRRQCAKDCIFSPYFPSNDLQRFTFVHKIYGASKVAKMLEQIPEGRREEATKSMVIEARSRVQDPVYGIVGILTQLREQILEVECELAKTQGLIAFCQTQNNLTQDP
ncbi:LOB domain-containing protein 23-like [Silene latifolia]|uniref:LOB domain-containing protein 23-like n=1 Tax=Silene latifolia TaxID=37657 RepID=UPI003D77514F